MDPHRRRATLATAAVLATAGVVAVVASRPASPFTPPLYPGARAFPPLVWLAGALGLDRLSRDAVGVIGAAALFASAAAFLFALVQAWRGALPTRRVVLVAVILHVLAVAIPLFLSRDVYSYAIYGRMVSHHGANPYTDIVTAFKVLAAVASLGTVLLVLAAARRLLPERAAFAAVLVGWNPVVVFHGVAGGHNDAILALAVAAAVLAIAARRELWGTAALALGTLVKVSGAIPLLVAVVAAVLRRPAGERWRAFWLHAGVAAAVSVPFVVPFMQTEDPTLGTLELTSRQGWLAPSRFVLTIVRGVARVVGGDVAYDVASLLVRVAFPLLFGWVLATLLRHLARDRLSLQPEVVLGAMGWASLISLLVSPVLLPWYAAWVLPLAWFLPNPARGGAVLVSVALTITELVAEPTRSPGVWEAMVFGLHWVATPIVLLVLIRLVLDLRRRAALVPAGGPSSPLVVERLDAESVGGRLPRRAVASSDQPGGRVSGTTDGDAERHRDRTIEREAESIGHERRRDAQGRSD
jgi:hypothetical protein